VKPFFPYNERVGHGLQRNSRGDVVAHTLQYFRERTASNDTQAPEPFADIREMLKKTVEEGKRVLIDIKESYSVQTVVVRVEYIGARWAMGKSICYQEGEEVEVPYTIHFTDILCKKLKIKVITEGENPFHVEES
jgi:predicted metal-dependent RNase